MTKEYVTAHIIVPALIGLLVQSNGVHNSWIVAMPIAIAWSLAYMLVGHDN